MVDLRFRESKNSSSQMVNNDQLQEEGKAEVIPEQKEGNQVQPKPKRKRNKKKKNNQKVRILYLPPPIIMIPAPNFNPYAPTFVPVYQQVLTYPTAYPQFQPPIYVFPNYMLQNMVRQ